MRIRVSDTHLTCNRARAQLPIAVIITSQVLVDLLFTSLVVFAPAIMVVMPVMDVIKQVYVIKSIIQECKQTKNCTAQCRNRLCERIDKEKPTDHRDGGSVLIPESGGIYLEDYEIPPIRLDRGGRHIS